MNLFDELKESMTVACCKRCDRFGDVQIVAENFWCAWCGKSSEVHFKRVDAVLREKFESLHVAPSGEIIDPNKVPLQPLRVTSGWKIVLRNHLFEIDPTPETVQNIGLFNQTMLVMSHEDENCLLDVGWTPEANIESGEYNLNLYDGDYDGAVLKHFRTKDRLALVREIESILDEVTCQPIRRIVGRGLKRKSLPRSK